MTSPDLLRHSFFFGNLGIGIEQLHEVFGVLFNSSQQGLHVLVGKTLNFEANSCALAAFNFNLLKVS